jgi:hypothetical protein
MTTTLYSPLFSDIEDQWLSSYNYYTFLGCFQIGLIESSGFLGIFSIVGCFFFQGQRSEILNCIGL